MIRLRPWLRAFSTSEGRWIESVLEERALPLDDALLDVLRALANGPVAAASELSERSGRSRGEVHGALARLSGVGLVEVGEQPVDIWSALAKGNVEVPVVDNIELTNICPMSCAMCPTGSGRMTRAKGRMSSSTFAKIVSEIAPHKNHGKPVALHNLGESATHPELVSFVKLASSAGLATELSSNPGHMPLDLFRALEDAGLTRLVLSLDGIDEETLTRIRGKGARAQSAFENVEALRKHVESRSPPLPLPSGEGGGGDARASRHIPPPRGGEGVGNGSPPRPHVGTHVVVQLIRQRANASQAASFLARYSRSFTAYVKELDANTVDDDGALYEIGRAKRPYLCGAPWKSVVVLWNGDVVPCCHDANGAVVYGNVEHSSLRDVWRDDAARSLRERLRAASTKPGEPCHSCAHRADRYAVPPLDEIPVEPLHW